MNLQFLPATETDIRLIYEQAKLLIETYEDITSIDYEKVLGWVKRKLHQEISSYCRVQLADRICGYYRLCADGELDDLYVLPGFQNRGIGTEILKKCIAESKEPLYLYVFTRNVRAISFYERFGFEVREKVGKTRMILERKG